MASSSHHIRSSRSNRGPGTRWLGLLAVQLVILATLLAACAPPAVRDTGSGNQANAERGTATRRVTAVVMGEPPTLSVKINSAGAGGIVPGADAIEELVSGGLSHLDHANALHPQLAEAVPSVENGLWKVFPDG